MSALSKSAEVKSEREVEEEKPRNIALAIFRFRARRGLGVYYALLSTVPLLVGILQTFSAPAYLILGSVGLQVVGILYLARFAGMKRLYQMRFVIGLFDQDQNNSKSGEKLNKLLESARTVFITLLPLGAAALFAITDNAILGLAVLVAFVSYVLARYVLINSKKSDDSVLPWFAEDWIVAFLTPALLALYFFQLIDITAYLISLLLLFLLAGIKSSYEAPQSLVQVLDDDNEKDSNNKNKRVFASESLAPLRRQDAVSVSEFVSGSLLSSLTRVGIMLALLGVGQITFTDLMFVVKMSKSSLNFSVNALQNAGYVTVHKGFKRAGGPRTFIEITNKGKEAIHSHLENMQTLASKYLS